MRKIILLFLLLNHSNNTFSQVEKGIENYFHRKIDTLPAFLLKKENKHSVLNEIEKYRADTLEDNRLETYRLITELAQKVVDKNYKYQLIENLVLSQLDSSMMVRINSPAMLQRFKASDYNIKAIEILKKLLLPQNKRLLNFGNILILGFLGIQSDVITALADKPMKNDNDFGSLIWASKLALARMGNKKYTNECIESMRKYKDDLNEYYRICKHAAYIKNMEAIRFLEVLLNSDMLQSPTKREAKGERIARHALIVIQKIIKNILVKSLEKYTDKEVDEQLQAARKWMKENRRNYKINIDEF